MANVLPDPLPGERPAGPESRAADAAVAQLRRLDAALASLPAAAGASAAALAAARAELLRSRGAVQAAAGRMPAPALRAAEMRANLLIPGSGGRSDPGSAGRDANAMAASARFAEARRRALSDTRIAGALRDQAAAMRGGGSVQIPGSELAGG